MTEPNEEVTKLALDEENAAVDAAVKQHLQNRVIQLNVQLREARAELEELRSRLGGEGEGES